MVAVGGTVATPIALEPSVNVIPPVAAGAEIVKSTLPGGDTGMEKGVRTERSGDSDVGIGNARPASGR